MLVLASLVFVAQGALVKNIASQACGGHGESRCHGFQPCKKGHSLKRHGVHRQGWADNHCFACGGHLQPRCVDTKAPCLIGHEIRHNGLCYRCGGLAEPVCITTVYSCREGFKERLNHATQSLYCYNCGVDGGTACADANDLCPKHLDPMLDGHCVTCGKKKHTAAWLGELTGDFSSTKRSLDTGKATCRRVNTCKGNLNLCFRCGGHGGPACQYMTESAQPDLSKECSGFLEKRPNGPYAGLCMPPVQARRCEDEADKDCLKEDEKSTSTCQHIKCKVSDSGNIQVLHNGKEDKKVGHHCAMNLHQPWSADPGSAKCGCDCFRKYVGDEDLFADVLTLKAEKAMQARAALAFKEEMQMDKMEGDGGR